MTEKQWKSKIKKNCKDAGTYRKYFEPVIETLAGILSKRDDALEQFLASGGKGDLYMQGKFSERGIKCRR